MIVHGERRDDPRLEEAVQRLRDRGAQVTCRVTEKGGDAVRFARDAGREDFDVLLAAGGDGLLNAVVCGIHEHGPDGPSLGIVPLGTANDFACSLGVPESPADAALLALEQPAAAIDLGLVNGQPFINMATGGFGAQITDATPAALKRILGGAAYTLTGLSNVASLRALEGQFTGDAFHWNGWFLVCAIGNGQRSGGGHLLCPSARLDDGQLDVTIVPSPSESEPGRLLEVLLTKGLDGLPEAAVRAQVRSLEVELNEPMHVNRDGEPTVAQNLSFEVAPGALRLHLPAAAPMMQAV